MRTAKVRFLGGPGRGEREVPTPLPETVLWEVPGMPERWVPWEDPASSSPRAATVTYRLVPARRDRFIDQPAHYALDGD